MLAIPNTPGHFAKASTCNESHSFHGSRQLHTSTRARVVVPVAGSRSQNNGAFAFTFNDPGFKTGNCASSSSSQTGFGFAFDDGQHTSGGSCQREFTFSIIFANAPTVFKQRFSKTEESTEPKLFFRKLILLNLFSMP